MITGAERKIVRTAGAELEVWEAGTGPAVVLLHGFPELAYSWRHQVPALADAGFHVIAFVGYMLKHAAAMIQGA